MRFAEIERICEEIDSTKQELEAKRAELQKLESEATKKTKEAQMLEEIAKLRGKKYEGEPELEELKKAKKDVEDYQEKIKELERGVFEGLKDLAFDIPLEVPRVDSDERSIIKFEGDPCNYAVRFIASTLSSGIPLELDKTELHPDKIVVTNVKEPIQVVERLKILRSNIGRLAWIALQEKDPDIEEIADYLHGSNYREIWETVKGRRMITYNDLFFELSLKTSEEQRRIRNFFTNLEHLLKDKFPFIRVSPGVYELAFFGSLVWKRYCDKYLAEEGIAEDLRREAVVESPVKKEKKPEIASLNKYLSSNEVKEIIYGKEVS